MNYALRGKRVYVAGHRGMVGSALLRRLAREGCHSLTVERSALDLRDQRTVDAWFEKNRPQAVLLAAARVGGIVENDAHPADFLYDNLAIATNVIEASRRTGVEKLLFLGSSCIYPRLAPQPMSEDVLLSGPLEPTNEGFAIAKLAGIKLCQSYRRQHSCDFISVIPANLYGPNDNFDQRSGHVLAALIARTEAAIRRRADTIEIWGTGRSRREFLQVDDVADAIVYLMKSWSSDAPINIGCGTDLTIAELARLIAQVAGFTGEFVFDPAKPDGMPRKVLDVTKLTALGWRPRIDLETGIRQTYEWYRDSVATKAGTREL